MVAEPGTVLALRVAWGWLWDDMRMAWRDGIVSFLLWAGGTVRSDHRAH